MLPSARQYTNEFVPFAASGGPTFAVRSASVVVSLTKLKSSMLFGRGAPSSIASAMNVGSRFIDSGQAAFAADARDARMRTSRYFMVYTDYALNEKLMNDL